jgi:hypothetical protein
MPALTPFSSCPAPPRNPSPPPQLVNVGTNTVLDPLFRAAKARWESVLTRDAPDAPLTGVDWSAGIVPGFSYRRPVDDLVIFFR